MKVEGVLKKIIERKGYNDTKGLILEGGPGKCYVTKASLTGIYVGAYVVIETTREEEENVTINKMRGGYIASLFAYRCKKEKDRGEEPFFEFLVERYFPNQE